MAIRVTLVVRQRLRPTAVTPATLVVRPRLRPTVATAAITPLRRRTPATAATPPRCPVDIRRTPLRQPQPVPDPASEAAVVMAVAVVIADLSSTLRRAHLNQVRAFSFRKTLKFGELLALRREKSSSHTHASHSNLEVLSVG